MSWAALVLDEPLFKTEHLRKSPPTKFETGFAPMFETVRVPQSVNA
jgi:hypothetical protein